MFAPNASFTIHFNHLLILYTLYILLQATSLMEGFPFIACHCIVNILY